MASHGSSPMGEGQLTLPEHANIALLTPIHDNVVSSTDTLTVPVSPVPSTTITHHVTVQSPELILTPHTSPVLVVDPTRVGLPVLVTSPPSLATTGLVVTDVLYGETDRVLGQSLSAMILNHPEPLSVSVALIPSLTVVASQANTPLTQLQLPWGSLWYPRIPWDKLLCFFTKPWSFPHQDPPPLASRSQWMSQ